MRRSFYDGSGKYSERTHEMVNNYLSNKSIYDTRTPRINRAIDENNGDYAPMGTYNGAYGPLSHTNKTKNLPNNKLMSKSLSMAELNNRIKNTINVSKRAYRM